jgi:hypothetical protein
VKDILLDSLNFFSKVGDKPTFVMKERRKSGFESAEVWKVEVYLYIP